MKPVNIAPNDSKQTSTQKIPASPIHPLSFLSYQDGAVVSRTLVNKKTGTVTLFAFDAGEGLSEHTAPFDALVYLLDGEAEIIISGASHHLKTGEMILLPANEPHALKATKRFKMILTMIKSE
jgi:quercetin dioxygenase-like cupin family protein